MAAIHSGTCVVVFGATMCCSNLSLPLFGNTGLVEVFILCLCAGQSNNTANLRALDLDFVKSIAYRNA